MQTVVLNYSINPSKWHGTVPFDKTVSRGYDVNHTIRLCA